MTDITDAAVQLQQWLDSGTDTPPPTSVVRTVLRDLVAGRRPGQPVTAAPPAEVWYYADDDEISSFDVYADGDIAKAHAVERYISEYEPDDEAFTWRKAEPRPGGDQGRSHWLLHHGESTGWHVSTMRVIASVAKAGA